MQRSLKIFEHSIRSDQTRETYKYMLEKFRKWSKVNNSGELLQADQKSIQMLIEDYVMYLKGKISPNSFTAQLAPVILFFQVNDINLNLIKIKKMYPDTVKKSGYGAYSREDIQSMLENTNKKRTKAIIHVLSSTGCRAGGLVDLKMKDIEDYENCKSILFYADAKEEYHGFLTPEACKALDDYLLERIRDNERFTPETPVFRESYQLASLPARHLSLQLLTEIIEVTLKNIKRVRTPNGRYTVQLVHGFRKYFNLVMKDRSDSNLSLCEKLMGHSVTIPLDNNYAPFSKEKLFEEFRKAIPELTVSDVERKQTLIESQKKEITELSKRDLQVDALSKTVEEIKEQQFETQKILTHTLFDIYSAGLEEWDIAGGKIPKGLEEVHERRLDIEHNLLNQVSKLRKATGKPYKINVKEYEEKRRALINKSLKS